jgi:hypothetical protein
MARFSKHVLDYKTCVLIFSTNLSEMFLILRRIERDIMLHRFSCKVPVIFLDVNENWISSTNFREVLKYKISWKSIQWEPSCCAWTDGRTDGRTGGLTDRQTDRWTEEQTDMTKLIVVFRNFANAPKMETVRLAVMSVDFCQRVRRYNPEHSHLLSRALDTQYRTNLCK